MHRGRTSRLQHGCGRLQESRRPSVRLRGNGLSSRVRVAPHGPWVWPAQTWGFRRLSLSIAPFRSGGVGSRPIRGASQTRWLARPHGCRNNLPTRVVVCDATRSPTPPENLRHQTRPPLLYASTSTIGETPPFGTVLPHEGLTFFDGRDMLLQQAVHAFRLFTRETPNSPSVAPPSAERSNPHTPVKRPMAEVQCWSLQRHLEG